MHISSADKKEKPWFLKALKTRRNPFFDKTVRKTGFIHNYVEQRAFFLSYFFHAQMTDTIADGNFCARCLCGHIDCPIEHNFSYVVNGHGRMREIERPNAALERKPHPNGRKKQTNEKNRFIG